MFSQKMAWVRGAVLGFLVCNKERDINYSKEWHFKNHKKVRERNIECHMEK